MNYIQTLLLISLCFSISITARITKVFRIQNCAHNGGELSAFSFALMSHSASVIILQYFYFTW